jgi:hypothetical protein
MKGSQMPITNTCGGCDATWGGTSPCHCAVPGCHQTFVGVSLFDAHRSQYGERGSCTHPTEVRNRAGEQVMFLRDGMWRGPEMTDDQKTARFGAPA